MTDLTILLEDTPGALADLGEALGRAGVSIEGGGVFAHAGVGVGHFLFHDGSAARRALTMAGIPVAAENEVIVHRLKQTEPGQLGQVARCLAKADVNIIVMYSDHDRQLILVVDDAVRGQQVLEAIRRGTSTTEALPDIACVAAAIGEPARGRMLSALMEGRALTATELALEAGVAPSTASTHLAKLQQTRLIALLANGRHRYFRIATPEVAQLLERLMVVAASVVRPGPKSDALRQVRICYDHLAGALAVHFFDRLRESKFLTGEEDSLQLTVAGQQWLHDFGIDIEQLQRRHRPLVRFCLDWSERRGHLAGAVGAAVFERLVELRLTKREAMGRGVRLSKQGERFLTQLTFV